MNYLDYKTLPIRPAAILTGSYVASPVDFSGPDVLPEAENQIVLYVDFTIGNLTSAQLIMEFSADNTNWYQESYEEVPTAGVANCVPYTRSISASGTYRFAVPIKDRYIRVSAKGTGTATGSSMTITGIIGIA